jgi:hypothetical protein
MRKTLHITDYERKNCVLNNTKDLMILSNIKEIERSNLNKNDRNVIKLITTQLKKDWRMPLILYLNILKRRYKK